MFVPKLFIYLLLLGAAAAATQGGWTNGASATGTKDPNAAVGCDYWVNDVQHSDTCDAVVDFFGISLRQFVSWNPSLKYDYCVLVPKWSYCVSGPAGTASMGGNSTGTTSASSFSFAGTAAPTQSGIAKSCTNYHLVQNGDSCNSIQDMYMNFTLSQFYSWNPAISKGCKGLVNGDFVCVAAKSSVSASASASSTSAFPTQTGVVHDCNKWHYVSGKDDCDSIQAEYDLTPAQFYHLNPATGSKCSNLWRKTNVCVGEPGLTPSATITTTGSSSSTSAFPTQTGVASDCNKWHYVSGDDDCASIEKQYDLTTAEFYRLNPATGSNCTNLWHKTNVCVGAPGTTSS
ncbi:hypothetical protein ACN42_g3298 [Penicillium freii]|uniref:LysM domain-containing protein n=1 Tax=Penicillium freii TaxID=48697 RepID=A0A117NQD7_PENFR|nr:hypothetical protein ACN42_g3298 [Penicillium freii]